MRNVMKQWLLISALFVNIMPVVGSLTVEPNDWVLIPDVASLNADDISDADSSVGNSLQSSGLTTPVKKTADFTINSRQNSFTFSECENQPSDCGTRISSGSSVKSLSECGTRISGKGINPPSDCGTRISGSGVKPPSDCGTRISNSAIASPLECLIISANNNIRKQSGVKHSPLPDVLERSLLTVMSRGSLADFFDKDGNAIHYPATPLASAGEDSPLKQASSRRFCPLQESPKTLLRP